MSEDILFCTGGGCTAKHGPMLLNRILSKLPPSADPNLLVGFDSSDDAAVYRLSDELAFISTVDFFPPMVEDPYLFGQIAAANALSDIYAMGGVPKTALNLLCFPEKADANLIGRILEGGSQKVTEAGAVLAGGHSIMDEGIKYGLSVTGLVHPDKIWKNNDCREGDLLLLTKPLGTGILCTAQRLRVFDSAPAGKTSASPFYQAVRSMTTLNRYAAEILLDYPVHACTDVTGFGLLGHLSEMLSDRFSAVLHKDGLPLLPEALNLAEQFYITAAGQRNRSHLENRISFSEPDFSLEEILYDPQTSGGLLAALPPTAAQEALLRIRGLGLACGIIGRIGPKKPKTIYI